MESFWKYLNAALGTLLTWLSWLVGGWDAVLGVMFVAMGLDYITGVACAVMGRSPKTPGGGVCSSVAFAGLTRKLLMLVIVALAVLVDRLLGSQGVCRMAAIGFYAANEGLSIIENCSAMGVPFPQSLLDVLENIRSRASDDDLEL
ncbi:MAG: phage holin family protein [Clostridia bacterium]|nr:phage holin family protein [Clostridia bacterium]